MSLLRHIDPYGQASGRTHIKRLLLNKSTGVPEAIFLLSKRILHFSADYTEHNTVTTL